MESRTRGWIGPGAAEAREEREPGIGASVWTSACKKARASPLPKYRLVLGALIRCPKTQQVVGGAKAPGGSLKIYQAWGFRKCPVRNYRIFCPDESPWRKAHRQDSDSTLQVMVGDVPV